MSTARGEGDGVPGGGAGPSPLVRLRRSVLFLALCTAAGGLLAFGAGALRKPCYRAAATLLVVEPRGAAPGSVDYLLTPIRSYTALLTSPALAAACAAPSGAPPPQVRVRIPESTRLLELTVDGDDPRATAASAACLAARAMEENRRLNAEIARRGEAMVTAALEAARQEVAEREAEMARMRQSSLVELKRARLKAALEDMAAATDEERQARQRVDEEEAKRASFDDNASRRPAAREVAENGATEAQARAAGARAAALAASRARVAAEARAEALEREIAAREETLRGISRRLEGAATGLAELSRRSALAPLESAVKAFELQLVAPPLEVALRAGPSPALLGAAGAAAGAVLAALVVLSRPE